eukprot:scaffold47280_cov66-Cyclotella_meneghiniana.AAC.7
MSSHGFHVLHHRYAQHFDRSSHYSYRANTHPHATVSLLILRMVVSLDIAGATGGKSSVQRGCR